MSNDNQFLSEGKFDLSANEQQAIPVSNADEIVFYEATGDFEISVNNGEFVPFSRGKKLLIKNGFVGELAVKDTSGNSNEIHYYYSSGIEVTDATFKVVGSEQVQISNTIAISSLPDIAIASGQQVVALSPSLNSILDGANLNNASSAYSLKRWLRVTNTGGSAITVTLSSFSITVAAAGIYETPMLQAGGRYPSITVDATGSTAIVEFING